MKTCSKCKVPKDESDFYRRKTATDGLRSACKKCELDVNASREPLYKETRKRWRAENPEKYLFLKQEYYKDHKDKMLSDAKIWRQTPKGRLLSYKKGARDRGFEWGLSDEQFSAYWQKPCSYCGSDIQTIGLDRKDSKLGYIPSNITSCCAQCNLIKMNHSYEDFINKIKAIHKHLQL